MRKSGGAPSIVPNGGDQTVYLVLEDFGHLGRAWRETDADNADFEITVMDLLEGQYSAPVRVVAFNTAGHWSEDVSADIARELRRRCDLQMREIPVVIQQFVAEHEGRGHRQLTLRLV